ncbi:methylesterase 17-like isoform X1 [Rhododendron vialii]|uniref:methylesterase 17-like isoform X1 n=1 Tax=Rhododendron vialii TaxID=182163 RepID=UPI00265F564C|nr:methylesterase 17-like isoform X1 [Rhododendron vialii]
MTKVSHFVLVHGIGGGSWCWYKVRCQLENSGYKVSCIDLKGAGINQSDAKNIHTFDEYNKPLIDFMSSLPDDEKVIVVGHSAGGLSLTDATHKFGKKISLAIYLGATMLKTGMCNEQDIKDGVPNLSEFGDAYDYGYGYGPDKPPTSALLKKEFHRDLIYQLSPPEVLIPNTPSIWKIKKNFQMEGHNGNVMRAARCSWITHDASGNHIIGWFGRKMCPDQCHSVCAIIFVSLTRDLRATGCYFGWNASETRPAQGTCLRSIQRRARRR